RELPELLHSQAVRLRAAAGVEAETADELLRQAATRALRDDRRTRAHLGAGGEVGSRLTVLLQSHVTQLHARDGSVRGDERGRRREAGEDIDANGLGFLRQPGCQEAEGNDEVATVVQLRRQRQ